LRERIRFVVIRCAFGDGKKFSHTASDLIKGITSNRMFFVVQLGLTGS
jgi:hypothetical protein